MTTTYEPKGSDIINKCLDILSKPVKVIKDSHSAGYLENRKRLDSKLEVKLLNTQVNDEAYYDELSKDFDHV